VERSRWRKEDKEKYRERTVHGERERKRSKSMK
jgi:hypothetical protein